MVFKHSKFPNAAKAFLRLHDGERAVRAVAQRQLGYWSQPLAAYAERRSGRATRRWSCSRTRCSRSSTRLQGADLAGARRGRTPTTCWCRCARRSQPARRRRRLRPPKPNAARSATTAARAMKRRGRHAPARRRDAIRATTKTDGRVKAGHDGRAGRRHGTDAQSTPGRTRATAERAGPAVRQQDVPDRRVPDCRRSAC